MRLAISCAALVLASFVAAGATEPVPEPDTYRTEEYRAPTPRTLAGAEVIDTAAAERLWRKGSAVFIDVMPRAPKPAGLPPGTLWRDQKRDDIPGSIWLVNVGYGALSGPAERYFRNGLAEITAGDKARALVFYCDADCWMSWNAAKRALEWGYTQVAWFPQGTNGWAAAGLPLAEAVPHPPE